MQHDNQATTEFLYRVFITAKARFEEATRQMVASRNKVTVEMTNENLEASLAFERAFMLASQSKNNAEDAFRKRLREETR